MKQAHVFISGTVQGVGYRYFIKNKAREVGLTGWVRNSEDGGVEAVFQGEKETIEKMITICRQGPFLAEVKQVGFDWEEGEETFSEFSVQ